MKTDYLKYTDYEFDQEGCPYKVNTDTIALGVFLDPMYHKSVLDIGTNSGALLLYAHQKGAGMLYGVDIHEDGLKAAERNLKRYTDSFCLYHCLLQDLEMEKVDVIVCNPPFFEMNNVTPDPYLQEAMFESSLSLDELFGAIRKLMKDNGEAYLIYQADRFPAFYDLCKIYKLKIMKLRFVHDVHSRHALRFLAKLKIGPMSKLKIEAPLMVENGSFIEIR